MKFRYQMLSERLHNAKIIVLPLLVMGDIIIPLNPFRWCRPDSELSKYETWEECQKSGSHLINLLGVNREQEYGALRTKGVGQTTKRNPPGK